MRMNTSGSDNSCIVLENDISVIDLDVSTELNAEVKLAETADDILNVASDASILKISFKDATTYGELNNLIGRCVKNVLFYLQKSVICTEDSSAFTITFNETSTADNDLFIVDSMPAPEVVNIVPEYSRSEVIINDATVDPITDDSINAPKTAPNTCFNCDGNHSIRDCMKPKDLAKIKQNRAKFSSNKLSYERYHADVEQRFGHLVPGELSKELRNALGLRSKELPVHIYRMRVLGYPPGWLEHAKVSGSGLTMFDSEGKETDASANDDDEDKYDLKKIISFPGFNVDPPYGTRDDSRAYRAPPMQRNASKAAMIEHFRSRSTKAYKRKSQRTTDVTVLEPTDMDIDDESDDNDAINVPLGERLAQLDNNSSKRAKESSESQNKPKSPPTPAAPPANQSPLSDGEIIDTEPSRDGSPSLDDLNERKKRLLNALDDSAVSITTLTTKPSEDDSLIDDIMALQDNSTSDSSAINDENGDTTKTDVSQSTINASPPVTPGIRSALVSKSILHVSKESVGGTPVIKGVSPFSNLPKSDKWREGVSDVLDFENLPESIGKYEKMRTLIEKVRVKVKKIQYEDDEDR